MDEDGRMEQKAWHVYSFGKRNVFRLHFNESRGGFCWRGRVGSFPVDRLKTKGGGTYSRESGVRNLEAESIISEAGKGFLNNAPIWVTQWIHFQLGEWTEVDLTTKQEKEKKPSVGVIQPSRCMCLTSSEYSLGGQTGFNEGILSSRFTILADKRFWFVYHGIVLDRSEMFGVNVDEPKQATPPCGPKKPPPKPCPPQPTCPPPQQHPKPSDPCAKAQPCKTPCKPPQRPCGPQKPTPDPKKPDLRAPLFKALKVSLSLLDSHSVKAVSYFWSRISYHGKCQTMMSLLLLCQG